ncbi:MAG: hypothetical protein LUI87_13280 [Lachnospiraceae bacterium]|nr:hypothetical protein [Lachnospiraceae bacterium]
MNKEMIWLQMLSIIDKLNRSIKEPGWSFEDKTDVYALKDEFLHKLLTEKPSEVKVELFYVPYLRYSERTKDRAGELMRRDGRRHSFEYYLEQIEPSEEDRDDPSKASIEVIAECMEQSFSLHLPIEKLPAGYDIGEIPHKKWVPAMEFHHSQKLLLQEKYTLLTALLE